MGFQTVYIFCMGNQIFLGVWQKFCSLKPKLNLSSPLNYWAVIFTNFFLGGWPHLATFTFFNVIASIIAYIHILCQGLNPQHLMAVCLYYNTSGSQPLLPYCIPNNKKTLAIKPEIGTPPWKFFPESIAPPPPPRDFLQKHQVTPTLDFQHGWLDLVEEKPSWWSSRHQLPMPLESQG